MNIASNIVERDCQVGLGTRLEPTTSYRDVRASVRKSLKKSEIIWTAWKDVRFNALKVWKWGFVKREKKSEIRLKSELWHPWNHHNNICLRSSSRSASISCSCDENKGSRDHLRGSWPRHEAWTYNLLRTQITKTKAACAPLLGPPPSHAAGVKIRKLDDREERS